MIFTVTNSSVYSSRLKEDEGERGEGDRKIRIEKGREEERVEKESEREIRMGTGIREGEGEVKSGKIGNERR